MTYKSPLAKLLPESTDIEKLKRDGWNLEGILVVDVNDKRLDFVDIQFIERIGRRLYGRGK